MAIINERNRKWWTVLATALTTLLITIDFNGLSVALPTIGRDLGTSTTGLQWTFNAYQLAFAAPTVAAWRLADIFGRRKLLLISTTVFAVASAACGLAQTDWFLVAARVVQGIGASAFFAASLSIVSNAFPPSERSRGIGVWASIGIAGVAVGPLIGGFLTEALSWRWFFFVNIPITLLAIFLTVVAVRESRDETASRHVDLLGLVTVTGGLTALVLAIQQGSTSGWGSPVVIGSLVAAVVLLAAFLLAEPRLRDPLIELNLFGDRGFLGANAVAFTHNFGLGAIVFFLPLYFQNVLGYSPFRTGLVLMSFTVTLVICNSLAGWVAGEVGPRLPMMGGMAVTAVAFLLLALTTPASGLVVIVVALLVAGVGQAFAFTVSTIGGMAAVPEAKAGAASGILSTVRLMGAVFGVAVGGALFTALENYRLSGLITAAGGNLDASEQTEIRGLLSGSESAETQLAQLAPEAAEQIERVVREAFVFALDGTMLLCVLVSVAGALAAALLAPKAGRAK